MRPSLSENIRSTLGPHLEPGEEIRACIAAAELRGPAALRFFLSWVLLENVVGTSLMRVWWVAITPRRVLLGRPNLATKAPYPLLQFASVALTDVTIHRRGRYGGNLLVANAGEGLPTQLRLSGGGYCDLGGDKTAWVDYLNALLSGEPEGTQAQGPAGPQVPPPPPRPDVGPVAGGGTGQA